MRTDILTIAVILLMTLTVYAKDQHRQLGEHRHGHGSLNIAVEGNVLIMELGAPGADIVGFEHEAKSDEQKNAVKAAVESLAEPLELFVLTPAARCTVKNAKVNIAGEKNTDEHLEKANPSDLKHEAEHRDGEETHSEAQATYEISCKAASALTSIEFKYFDRFKGAEELEVNLITAKGQRQYEVQRGAPHIALEGMM